MKELNMAKVNTLIRKGYLFAGVIMAVNMFVVNEVKAMKNISEKTKDANPMSMESGNNSIPISDKKNEKYIKLQEEEINGEGPTNIKRKKFMSGTRSRQNFLDKVLSHENIFNLIGGLVFSVANSYLKWCDYNPGGYWNLRFGCLGLRSKRFLNGMLQFEGNLNLERGAFWSFFHIINLILKRKSKRIKKDVDFSWGSFLFRDILRGFISAPLTFHIATFNLSISISIDSIIWIGICKILEQKPKKEMTSNMKGEHEIINDNNKEKNIQENNIKDINKEIEINPKEIETTNIDKKEKKIGSERRSCDKRRREN